MSLPKITRGSLKTQQFTSKENTRHPNRMQAIEQTSHSHRHTKSHNDKLFSY